MISGVVGLYVDGQADRQTDRQTIYPVAVFTLDIQQRRAWATLLIQLSSHSGF